MQPKILIGCPTAKRKQYCLAEYAKHIKAINYSNAEILIVDNTKDNDYMELIKQHGLPVVKGPWFDGARDRIVTSRNILRQKVLSGDYDYFLSLEQDVMPMPDVLKRLLRHKKDIVSGVTIGYQDVNGVISPAPLVYRKSIVNPETLWFVNPEELKDEKLIVVDAVAVGCILIHRSVLKQITFRHLGMGGFDDIPFCMDARLLGYKIYVDTSVKPDHHISDWQGVRL